jgi:hypothetical protein
MLHIYYENFSSLPVCTVSAEVPERLTDADGRALEKENLRLQEKVVATEVGCTRLADDSHDTDRSHSRFQGLF